MIDLALPFFALVSLSLSLSLSLVPPISLFRHIYLSISIALAQSCSYLFCRWIVFELARSLASPRLLPSAAGPLRRTSSHRCQRFLSRACALALPRFDWPRATRSMTRFRPFRRVCCVVAYLRGRQRAIIVVVSKRIVPVFVTRQQKIACARTDQSEQLVVAVSLWAVSVFDYSCQQHNACLGVWYFRTLDSQASVVVKRIIIALRCVAAPTHIPTRISRSISRARAARRFIHTLRLIS